MFSRFPNGISPKKQRNITLTIGWNGLENASGMFLSKSGAAAVEEEEGDLGLFLKCGVAAEDGGGHRSPKSSIVNW